VDPAGGTIARVTGRICAADRHMRAGSPSWAARISPGQAAERLPALTTRLDWIAEGDVPASFQRDRPLPKDMLAMAGSKIKSTVITHGHAARFFVSRR